MTAPREVAELVPLSFRLALVETVNWPEKTRIERIDAITVQYAAAYPKLVRSPHDHSREGEWALLKWSR